MGLPAPASTEIAVTGLQDGGFITAGQVDQPVLVSDAARPSPGQGVFQRFGLADSLVGIAQGILNEPVDPFENLTVGRLPVKIVRPADRVKVSFTRPQWGSVRGIPAGLPGLVDRTESTCALGGRT